MQQIRAIPHAKPVLTIDVDDIQFDTMSALVAYANARKGTTYTVDDMTYWNHHFFGETKDERWQLFNEFYDSEHMLALQLMPGAKQGIAALAERYRLISVTSRPERVRIQTADAINEHFGSYIDDIHFAGGLNKQTKSSIIRSLGAVAHIEDAPLYLDDCVQGGIPAIMLERPWNAGYHASGVYGAADWPAIVEIARSKKLLAQPIYRSLRSPAHGK